MKTKVKKVIVVAMMVIVSTAGFASGKAPMVKIYAVGAKSIALYINGAMTDLTHVRLVDEVGFVLHSEVYEKGEGFSKKFNLNTLPLGHYFFEVESETNYGVFPLVMTTEKVVVKKEEIIVLDKPVIHLDGNVMDLLVSSDKSVEVEIYNEYRQLVFSETLNSETSVRRRYHLSSLTRGNYQVSVNVNEKGFTKLLALK